MRMPLEMFISLRYLKAKRRHRFISFISFISIAGVALGVMALIVVLAVMSGFEREMKEKVIGVYAELHIHTRALMYDWPGVVGKAEAVPGVVAASPFILNPLMLRTPQRQARGVMVRGIDPEGERRATSLAKFLKQGDLLASGPGILVGKALARELGLVVGDEVKLISPVEVDTPAGPVPIVLDRVIAGIFNAGMSDYDSNLIYADLATAQKLYRFGDGVHGVSVKIRDLYDTDRIQGELRKAFPFPCIVKSWMEQNPTLFAAVNMEKKVMFIIVTLIVLVAALNIASTLIMVVMEKTKDIGILKAIGVRPLSIMAVFTVEGAIIGAIGALIGTAAGLLFLEHINSIATAIDWLTGFNPFPSDIYYFDQIPVEFSWARICWTGFIALALSTIGALYPAWKASRLDPVEALRYE